VQPATLELRTDGQTDGGRDDGPAEFRGSFIYHPVVFYNILVCAPCIMHRCAISIMFGSCFWFF